MRRRKVSMHLKSGLAIALLSVLATQSALASGNACQAIFQADADTQSNINKSIKELVSLRLKLDEAKASGQSSVAISALESDYLKKEKEIFEFLVANKIMSQEELKERIRREIIDVQRDNSRKNAEEERRKEEQKREIKDPLNFAKKTIFHEIRPGRYKMGEEQIETEITQPFEMMSTQVTQMMWAQLKVAMGEKEINKISPSKFKSGTDGMTISIEGIDVEMKPDHPVEQVSYEDVQEFIYGLNRLSNSSDSKIQTLLAKLIPDHKNGDVYDLPTEAQWEFVMRDRGNANKQHFDRDDEADLPNHAWFYGNSDGQTHAVATLQPRMIDGKPFYDLEGNVWEWNKDWYNYTLNGAKDPQGASAGSHRVVRGGGWDGNAQGLRSGDRNGYDPGSRSNGVGFRLLRTSR